MSYLIKNKLRRLLFVENQFRSRMLAALILLLLIFVTNNLLGASQKMLTRVKTEKELVMNIPIMEKLLLSTMHRQASRSLNLSEEGPMNLQGTYETASHVYALINGNVLSEGDSYGDYKVVKIDSGVAILDNDKTRERKILQFFYYD